MELTLHVKITDIPEDYFTDDNYLETKEYIIDELHSLVEGLQGTLHDYEIK
jgi:hypothetical protein